MLGSGPPLLMYAPGGFDATIEKWWTQGVYARIKLLDHLPKKYTCIMFDRRECGQSGGRIERMTWAHYVTQGKGLLEHSASSARTSWAAAWGAARWRRSASTYPQTTLSMVLYWPVGGAKYRISSHQRFAEHLAFVQQNGLDGGGRAGRQETASRSAPTRAAGRGPRSSRPTLPSPTPMPSRTSTPTSSS